MRCNYAAYLHRNKKTRHFLFDEFLGLFLAICYAAALALIWFRIAMILEVVSSSNSPATP